MPFDVLGALSDAQRARAAAMKAAGELEPAILARYPDRHTIVDNSRLVAYVQDIKREYMRSSPPLQKVRYCEKINTLHRALGLHTYAIRVQGSRLKASNELRVATVFKELPPEFLRMVVVHELAHLRHKDHDKAFYRLCEHMEPEYHVYERDLRLLLYARE